MSEEQKQGGHSENGADDANGYDRNGGRLQRRTSNFDKYGFSTESDDMAADKQQYLENFQPTARRRSARWAKFFEKNGEIDISTPEKVKALVRKGIPDAKRGELWQVCSGARERQLENPGYFAKLTEKSPDPAIADQIELDLQRTFPSNREFRTDDGINKLRTVLRAFAVHNPTVAYCQSMNFIVALLLLFMPPEGAFWMLVQIVEGSPHHHHMVFKGYYEEGMPMLKVDVRVLSALLEKKVPKVFAALKRCHIDLVWICSDWFMSLFSVTLPATTVVRIWDSLFLEGYKILFRVSIALFKMNEAVLAKATSLDQVMEAVKGFLPKTIDFDALMKIGFRKIGSLSKSETNRLREVFLRQVEEEREENRRRREQLRQIQQEKQEQQAKAEASQPITAPRLEQLAEDERSVHYVFN
eukprot:GILK01003011.1.p1 GENE.GILK01003011.1~~GILK01003011.1.p1  ORF type:complete len:414 (-),score=93.17 GILK01003011.1:96-1337(-)